MYVILGATGNTGKPLAHALLDAGKKVRAVSRDASKAKELADKGAEIVSADLSDVAALTRAFTGATAVYALVPPNYASDDFYAYQMNLSDSIAEALEAAKVPYVITLSSIGADLSAGAGVVQGLHYMENRFNQVPGANILHLRPTYFLENTMGNIATIKHMGIMGSPLKGDMPIPMIATRDIAAYAAKRMLALDFQGKGFQDLLGARDVSYNEMASVLGGAIGKPDLKYVEFPYPDAEQAMITQWGLSPNVAGRMIEFMKACNAGSVRPAVGRNAESTTPTTPEEFAGTFAYVFNMN